MRDQVLAEKAVEYAGRFIGIPYRYGDDEYGGDDPIAGMDCSGFITELLRGVGLLNSGERLSAKMFYDRWGESGAVNRAGTGVLVVYGKDRERISHIAMCVDKRTIIEAGGGTKATKDDRAAAIQNAFVRIRPIEHRADEIVAMFDPFRKV